MFYELFYSSLCCLVRERSGESSFKKILNEGADKFKLTSSSDQHLRTFFSK